MLGETVGTIYVTSSGYITSHTNQTTNVITHEPTRIFHIHLISSGTGASVIQISNGQTGSIYISETGTSGKGADFDYGMWGMTFPASAYVTVDSNIVSASIICKADKF